MERFDTVIRGGTVYDGSGAAPFRADLGLTSSRIASVGDLSQAKGEEEIDATGRAVSPGFIDVHTHDDRMLLSGPEMAAKVSQGVTTVVCGNCGISLAPLVASDRPPPPLDLLGDASWYRFPTFASYLETLDRQPAAANAVFLVGHQTLRVGAMDRLDRPATAPEIAAMRVEVEKAMQAGAVGFSTGLFYPPARHAPTEEVVELTRAVAPYGGLYTTHLRDEGPRIEESVAEALEIGRRAGVGIVLSHHKASGRKNHGKVAGTLAMVAEAAKTQPVALDVYPYTASSTMLLADRLDEATKILITWSEPMPEATGRDLAELAAEHGVTLLEMVERLKPAGAIYFAMAEADVQRVLSYPGAMIGSDGIPHDQKPHPRLWGTFPRVVGHYARDLGLMPMAEAVRRMTGLSAATFGLKDRGLIREGYAADLVIFDPATIKDSADFDCSTRPAAGIDRVMVAGQAVWRDGKATGAKPGRALRRAPI
ncbi:MAG: amidohydrolase family protein [Alphaproteobacteria bacterium]